MIVKGWFLTLTGDVFYFVAIAEGRDLYWLCVLAGSQNRLHVRTLSVK